MATRSRETVETFGEILARRAAEAPDRLAFSYLRDGHGDAESLTYGQLHARAGALAARLLEQLPAGSRLLLLIPPGPDYISAVFGCFHAGMVAVSAAPPQPKRLHRTLARLYAIAADAQVAAVLTTRPIMEAAAAAFGGDEQPLMQARWITVDEPLAGTVEPAPSGAAEVAFMQYTSGSTNDPRGVLLTHGNLAANSRFIARSFGHSSDSRGFIWLPPYHDMGLIGGILQPVYVGFPCVLVSPVAVIKRPLRWLEGISRHRATTSGGPNFAFDLCVRRIPPSEREQLDLSSWEVAFNGAEPIAPRTLEAFSAAFAPCGFRASAFFPCYGLAEATLMVTATGRDAAPTTRTFDAYALERGRAEPCGAGARAATLVGCGEADADHAVAIVDPESGRRVEPGRVGEIWVSGPSVAPGYWRHEAESERLFRARIADAEDDRAYLRTGDLGVVVDGDLFVVGRLKEVIIVAGRNLHPHDVELSAEAADASLRAHCSAAFAAGMDGREAITAVLEVEAGADASDVVAAVRLQVAQDLDVQLRRIVLCKPGSVPKTTSGKIQRQLCRALLERGELETVADWRAGEEPPAAAATTA